MPERGDRNNGSKGWREKSINSMDRGRGAYLSQSRLASSREKPRLENITLFSCPTRSDDNNNPSFARESGRRKGFLNRSCVVSCSSRFYDFSTINFYPRIFFPPLPINRSNHYPTTLHFVTFITNYNAPRERFRNGGTGRLYIHWQISEDLSRFVSQLALNKENIRPLCLPTVKLRGTRHYYLNGVKLLSRVSLSLCVYVFFRVCTLCIMRIHHRPPVRSSIFQRSVVSLTAI